MAMQDLIDRIGAATGLDPAQAEKALGITFSLLQSEGDEAKVEQLFAKLPGAAELAERHGKSAKSGFLGGLLGGPMVAIGKLQSAGLNMNQIKQLGQVTLDYAKEKAGSKLVKEAAGSIPGLSGYV